MLYDIKLVGHYLKPHSPLVVLNLVLMTIMAFLQGFGIGILIPILQSLSGGGEQNVFTQTLQKVCVLLNIPYGFNSLMIAFAGMYFLRLLIEALQNHYNRVLTATFSANLQTKAFDNLMDLPLAFYYRRKVGDLISTLYTSSTSSGGIVDNIMGFVKSGFLILVYFVIGCLISLKMTIFIIFMGLISLVLVRSKFNVVQSKAQEQKQIIDRIHSFLYDTLSGIKSVKNFINENRHRQGAETLITSFKKYAISIMDSKVIATLQLEAFLFLMIIISLFIAVNYWHVPLVSLVIILFICVQLVPQVKNVNRCVLGIKEYIPHISKVHELINRSDKYYLPVGPAELPIFKWEIRLEHLYFRYDGTQDYVLKDINMVINKGATIALVGSSGAGKTTLVDLILRYHDPVMGRIQVDGKNLKEEISIENWKQNIGSVEQDPYIFNDTVYENILYGKPEASREEVIWAAKFAHAHRFIEALPDGYNTVVGSRGMTLSGGQKQRIALARVLIKNPAILVLDEATSALDSESEKYIQKAIEKLRKKTTLIIIAHRLSTILNADKIFFLDCGQIVEAGNHETLIRQGGRYSHFYNLQFRKDSEEDKPNIIIPHSIKKSKS